MVNVLVQHDRKMAYIKDNAKVLIKEMLHNILKQLNFWQQSQGNELALKDLIQIIQVVMGSYLLSEKLVCFYWITDIMDELRADLLAEEETKSTQSSKGFKDPHHF